MTHSRPVRISHSRLQTIQTCQRLHHIQYVEGYKPVEREVVLDWGTELVHAPLEHWFKAYQAGKPQDALPAALASIDSSNMEELDKLKARILIAGYDARWAGAMADYEVLAVEVPFEIKRGNFIDNGKIDGVLRQCSTGRELILEHKSVSQKTDIGPASDYWRRLRMEPQVSMYYRGARELGFDPVACLWDVLVRPDMKLLEATPEDKRRYTKKEGRLDKRQRAEDETLPEFQTRLTDLIAENPQDWYARKEVVRLSSELEEFGRDVEVLSQQCADAEDPFHHAPRNPGSCFKYGGRPCWALDVCNGSASLDDETKYKKRSE